jgi:signal peptidase II
MKLENSFKEIKKNILKKENIFYLVLIIVIFFFDRFSKLKVIENFSENSYYVNNYINFELIWNIGIGFGFLSTSSTLIYNLVTILISLVIIFIISIFVISERLDKLIYSIVIGGALGNLYDRLTFKAVPDFIDIHYNDFHWFTFNVADIFITIGILILIIRNIFVKN